MMKFFFFAHDPGGGQAVAVVAGHLLRENSCQLDVFAAGPSIDLYRRLGMNFKILDGGFSQALTASAPDVVLTATSLSAVHDRALIREAQNLGIPVMAIIDYWSNYRLRFTSPDGPVYPDVISSIDTLMTEEMIADGIPVERIVETGQPVFDDLVRVGSPQGLERRARARRSWQVTEDEFVILYASQPVAGYYGSSQKDTKYLGFTEFDVTKILLNCLNDLANSDRSLHLIMRPHPKEERSYYETLTERSGFFSVTMDSVENAYESVHGADVVVGISSILLIEAAVMGRVAISVQPNLIGLDQLKSNIVGLTRAAYSEAEIRSFLARSVLDLRGMESELVACREHSFGRGKAVANVIRALFQLAKKQKTTVCSRNSTFNI